MEPIKEIEIIINDGFEADQPAEEIAHHVMRLMDQQHDEFYNEVRIAYQEKEMASYRHAKYAGELREEIKRLKEAFEENKKEIDNRGLICQRYRRTLEEIGANHGPPTSKIANDALWDVEQMHKLNGNLERA